ncbi:MAG: anthranilate synthase component I family protein [Aquificaceae bacterium]|nr:anthranilate synthase component I family protein [Aquificaceae bacterium]
MKFVFSGGWLGRKGLYEASIKKVHLLGGLEDLKPMSSGFLVLSYHAGAKILELPLKTPSYPYLILLELGDIIPFKMRSDGKAELKFSSSSFGEKGYTSAVERVRELIAEGVIYQLNLTCRFDFEFSGDPMALFLRYYQQQPVPYAFFLEVEDFYLLSGSMELFLEKRGRLLQSKPIKGTSKSREELLKSHKDRAENLMITDMVRNDLSRVALPGSVRVEELFCVKKFRTLFQMHSCVTAQTEENLSAILGATFPPASVVGAPKRKAVEVIDQIEPHNREYYCGCAGFLWGEDFTLSVLIRTAIGSKERLSYYAGAGIVWDSLPQKEWQEVLLKTRAFYGGFRV